MLRRLIGTAVEIQEMAFTSEDDVDETLDRAESLIFEVAERRVVRHAGAVAPGARADAAPTREPLRPRHVDHRCARPATTTSTSCCSGSNRRPCRSSRPARARARRRSRSAPRCTARSTPRKPVIFFSMEMGHLELTKRLLAAEAQIDAAQALDRPALGARVAEAQPGGRPARRSAVLHRRQPALHGDGDAGEGAPHEGEVRRPRAWSSSTTSSSWRRPAGAPRAARSRCRSSRVA